MPVSEAEQSVLERIDEAWLTDLTVSLLQATGQNPPGDEAATVATLAAAAADLGLDVAQAEVEPRRNNLRITLGGGAGPGLLLLGHTDVVPIGDGWTTDPFGGVIADGRIYGRGASDMKGGLAASLAALAALRGSELSGPVELAALVDEEDSGKGIRAYVTSTPTRFAGCITAEPTDLQTIIGARGDSTVRVEIHGRACHAGNPADGANAIYGAAAVVAEIEQMHAALGADTALPARSRHVERRPDPRRQRRVDRGGGVRAGRRPPTASRRISRSGARLNCSSASRGCDSPTGG